VRPEQVLILVEQGQAKTAAGKSTSAQVCAQQKED